MKMNPSLQDVPLPLSTQTNFDKLVLTIVAVSVNYYVLRSQKENNS